MITHQEARRLVVKHIDRPDWLLPGDDLIVLDETTIEKAWGWVFFYTSKLWHETGEIEHAVAGNAPLIVERESGRILTTGTAHPVKHYIENYERCGDPHG